MIIIIVAKINKTSSNSNKNNDVSRVPIITINEKD
jgi:hypothetical protein